MSTYTELSKVKNKLRFTRGQRVRFSAESLVSVSSKTKESSRLVPNDDLLFNPDSVEIGPEFGDDITMTIEFTDPTTFNCFLVQKPDGRKMFSGSGTTTSPFITTDGLIEIAPSAWGGTIEEGDEVYLEFRVDMSDEVAAEYIEEVEYLIDGVLSTAQLGVQIGTDLIFPTQGDVPDLVCVAATYFAAYYIYTDLFADKEVEAMSKDKKSFSERWLRKAKKYLNKYIESQKANVHPRAYAFPAKFNKIGLDDIHDDVPGLETASDDYDKLNRDSKIEEVYCSEDYEVTD